MAAPHSQLKRDKILQILRRKLASGEFPPGTALPSEHQLRRTYGVGRNTIREATSVLVQEGLVERIRGKGTIVQGTATRPTLRTCLLLTRASGDLYERQTLELQHHLQLVGVMPSVVDAMTDCISPYYRACLDYALDRQMDGMILDVPNPWVLDHCLERQATLPISVINYFKGDTPPVPCHQVLAGYYQGTFKATQHLRELGHERIMLVSHRNMYLKPGQEIEESTGLNGEFIHGYLDSLGDLQSHFFHYEHALSTPEEMKKLADELRQSKRPTAAVVTSDYQAIMVIRVARSIGLRVPQDLAVVGFFNTPWAIKSELPLTSVDIHPETIAQKAVDHLFGSDTGPIGLSSKETIEPELIIRQSCGAHAQMSHFNLDEQAGHNRSVS